MFVNGYYYNSAIRSFGFTNSNYGTFATIKNKTATMVGRSRWKENEDVGCSVVWLEVFLLLGKSVAEQ